MERATGILSGRQGEIDSEGQGESYIEKQEGNTYMYVYRYIYVNIYIYGWMFSFVVYKTYRSICLWKSS